jgi:hypothetical protein
MPAFGFGAGPSPFGRSSIAPIVADAMRAATSSASM